MYRGAELPEWVWNGNRSAIQLACMRKIKGGGVHRNA